jgi:phosphohistidine swiveling domain-containing protein
MPGREYSHGVRKLVALRDAGTDPAQLGGKAAGLARLLAAGLPVPPTMVLPADAAAQDLEAALALGEVLIVRSSATVEDAAPGLFRSIGGVRGLAALARAVQAVRASVDDPLARAALAARGHVAPLGMPGVIQAERPAGGAAASRAPGAPEQVLIEQGERPRLVPRAAAASDEVARLVLAAEQALGGPVEVEWVSGERIELVQARPLLSAPVPPWPPAAELDFSRREPGLVWRWDAAHDPSPLSPAQAELVARVDQAAVTRARLRVVGGYLYTASAATSDAPAFARWPELWQRSARALEPLLAEPPPPLAQAIDAYVAFVAAYDALAACIAAARRVEAHGGGVREAAAAPWGWDVARLPAGARPPAAPAAPRLDPEQDEASGAATLAEHDDALFAAAQLGLRRAIDARCAALGLEPELGAWCGLAALLGQADAAQARAAQAVHAEAARHVPPLVITAGHGLAAPPGDPFVRRGRGVGGRARGLAVMIDPPEERPPAGAIAVVSTVWPGFAACFREVAGLVAEHGGLLGHGVALARELGVPCVVGIAAARTWLADGGEVFIDGGAGLVCKTAKGASD